MRSAPSENKQKPTQTLPEGYGLRGRLDLIKDRKLLLILSLASVVMLVICGAGLLWLLKILRPDFTMGTGFSLTIDSWGPILSILLILLGVTFSMLILHEAIHGLFFWIFTGGRVKFAFKGAYAYAAAPDWYLPKYPYLVVSLAPLVLMTLLGIVALLWVPTSWIPAITLLITMNASGAVGDIYVFFWLLGLPGDVLIRDFGEQMEVYTHTSE